MIFKYSIGCLTIPCPAKEQNNNGNNGRLKKAKRVHRGIRHVNFRFDECYRIEIEGQPLHGITPRCFEAYVMAYDLTRIEGEGETLQDYERDYIEENLREAYKNPRKNLPDGSFRVDSKHMCFTLLDKEDWRAVIRICPRGSTYISSNFGLKDDS